MSATVAKDMGHDVARLLAPSPSFRHFVYDEAKVETWAEHLMNDKYHVSDEDRRPEIIYERIHWLLSGMAINVTYEIGDMAGILSFNNIIPYHKATLHWAMWDMGIFGKSGVRETIALLDIIMDSFKLTRIGSNTPDPKVLKLAQLLGFKHEGTARKEYRWNGELYDTYLLGRMKEN